MITNLLYSPSYGLALEEKTILGGNAAEEVEIGGYKDNDARPKPVEKPG